MTDLPVLEQMEAEVAASQEIITRAEAEIAKAQATIKVLEPAIKGLRSFGNGKPVRMAPARRSTGKPTKRHPPGPGPPEDRLGKVPRDVGRRRVGRGHRPAPGRVGCRRTLSGEGGRVARAAAPGEG